LRSGKKPELFVLDFGLSFNTTKPSKITKIEEIVGNRFLILPESAPRTGDARNPCADVTRAVGLLFYLLTGIEPKMLRDAREQPPHLRSDAPSRIREAWSERADAVLQLFNKGFTVDPRYRFDDADSLLAALEILENPDIASPPLQLDLEPTRHYVHIAASQLSQLHTIVSGDPINDMSQETLEWLE